MLPLQELSRGGMISIGKDFENCENSSLSFLIIFICCNATVLRKLPGVSESLVHVVDLS